MLLVMRGNGEKSEIKDQHSSVPRGDPTEFEYYQGQGGGGGGEQQAAMRYGDAGGEGDAVLHFFSSYLFIVHLVTDFKQLPSCLTFSFILDIDR